MTKQAWLQWSILHWEIQNKSSNDGHPKYIFGNDPFCTCYLDGGGGECYESDVRQKCSFEKKIKPFPQSIL